MSSDEAINLQVRKAVADVIELIGQARKKREAEEAERRREWEHQQAIAEEKRRVEALFKAAATLREYHVLTDYIEEVRRFGRVPDDRRREGQTLDDWLAWAEAQAQQIHPWVTNASRRPPGESASRAWWHAAEPGTGLQKVAWADSKYDLELADLRIYASRHDRTRPSPKTPRRGKRLSGGNADRSSSEREVHVVPHGFP